MFSPSFARLVVGKSCRKSAVPLDLSLFTGRARRGSLQDSWIGWSSGRRTCAIQRGREVLLWSTISVVSVPYKFICVQWDTKSVCHEGRVHTIGLRLGIVRPKRDRNVAFPHIFNYNSAWYCLKRYWKSLNFNFASFHESYVRNICINHKA